MQRLAGFHEALDGELVNLIIHDPHEDSGLGVSSIYSPTTEEIVRELERHGLPVQYTMDLVNARDPKVHTIIIDMETYVGHLREKGMLL